MFYKRCDEYSRLLSFGVNGSDVPKTESPFAFLGAGAPNRANNLGTEIGLDLPYFAVFRGGKVKVKVHMDVRRLSCDCFRLL